MRRCGEIIPGTLHGIGVAVALRARQAHGARGEELIQGHAVAIDTYAVVLRLGDLQQVHPDAGEADRLRRDRALCSGRDPLQVENVNAPEESDADQQGHKYLHREIVRRNEGGCNCGRNGRA